MSPSFRECRNFSCLAAKVYALIDSIIESVKIEFLGPGTPTFAGKDALGVPTAWGNPTVAKILRGPSTRIPVWAADTGEVHGPSVTPLFRSVPYIATQNSKLYAALAAVDLLRLGGARETEVALEVLRGLKI